MSNPIIALHCIPTSVTSYEAMLLSMCLASKWSGEGGWRPCDVTLRHHHERWQPMPPSRTFEKYKPTSPEALPCAVGVPRFSRHCATRTGQTRADLAYLMINLRCRAVFDSPHGSRSWVERLCQPILANGYPLETLIETLISKFSQECLRAIDRPASRGFF